jgi:hypothetical protein
MTPLNFAGMVRGLADFECGGKGATFGNQLGRMPQLPLGGAITSTRGRLQIVAAD